MKSKTFVFNQREIDLLIQCVDTEQREENNVDTVNRIRLEELSKLHTYLYSKQDD